METISVWKKAAVACLSLLAASATLATVTPPAQAATTTFGKAVNFTFEPAANFNTTVVKITPVDGANSYSVFTSGANPVDAYRQCGFGWTNCHWFAAIPMPMDRASKVTVMAAAKAGNRLVRVGVTSQSLFNPTDVRVAVNIAASLKWHDARSFRVPTATTPLVRQAMREYYRCKSWAPRAVSLVLVTQAALHDPEDLKGAYDLVTASDLNPATVRAFLGTATTSGYCERNHITRALGGAYLSGKSTQVTERLRAALQR
jgi:hypothetical protein